MLTDLGARVHHRLFGRVVAGALAAAGCDGGAGTPERVTTPPVEGGNRKMLKMTMDGLESKGKKK
jgi:hypothetical protein